MSSLGQAFIEFMPVLAPSAASSLTADATKVGRAAGRALSDALLKEVSDGAKKLGGLSASADSLVKSYGEIGTKAGKALGENLSQQAKKTTNVNSLLPDNLSQKFGEAGTKAGKALGSNIEQAAKRSAGSNSIKPPDITNSFGEAGTKAGTALGKHATEAINKNTRVRIPDADKESSEKGTSAGKHFASGLNEKLSKLKLPPVDIKADPKDAMAAIDRVDHALRALSSKAATIEIRANANNALSEVRALKSKLADEMGSAGDTAGKRFAAKIDEHAKGAMHSLKTSLLDGAKMVGPLALAGTVAAGVKVGSEFENNMNVMGATTHASKSQMKQANAKAMQLGNDVSLPGVSAADAAAVMTALSKGGLNVGQSMDAARSTLALSKVSGMSADKSAATSASAMNAFGLKAKDLGHLNDQFTNVANSSSVDVKDVADSFKMAAAPFSSFLGASTSPKSAVKDLTTSIGVLGQNGLSGSDAGTSLKQMLLQLTGPSKRAQNVIDYVSDRGNAGLTGTNVKGVNNKLIMGEGKKSVDTGMTLGQAMTSGSLKQQSAASQQLAELNPGLEKMGTFAYTAAGKMRPLHEQIKILSAGLKGMTEQEKAQTLTQIFGADATRAVAILTKTGADGFDKMAKSIEKVGSTEEIAKAKNKGLSGSFDAVKSSAETFAIQIYSKLSKPITGGLFALADKLPGIFTGLSTEVGKVVKPLGEVVKFAGNLFVAFKPIIGGAVVLGWLALRTAIQGLGAVLKPVNDFMSAHTTTTQILGTVIGVLVAAYNAERIAAALTGGVLKVQAIATTAVTVATRVAAIATNAWRVAQWLLNAAFEANPIGVVVVAVGLLVAALIYAYKHSEAFRNIVNAVWGAVKTAMAATIDWFVKTAWPALKAAWDALGKAATWLYEKAIKPAWDGIKKAVEAVGTWITGTLAPAIQKANQTMGDIILWLWNKAVKPAWDGIKLAIDIAWVAIQIVFKTWQIEAAAMGKIISWLYEHAVKPAWDAISKIVRDAWVGVKIIWDAIVGFINKEFKTAWDFLSKTVTDTWNAIKKGISDSWSWVKSNVFDPIDKFIHGPVKDTWTWFKDTVIKIWDDFKKGLSVAWTWVKDNVFTPIDKFIRGPVNDTWTWFKDTVLKLWDDFKKGLSVAWTWVKDNVFTPIDKFIRGPVKDTWTWFKDTVLKLWDDFKKGVDVAWTWVKDHVFTPIDKFIRSTVKDTWNWFKDMVNGVWDKIKKDVKAAWDWLGTNVFTPIKNFFENSFKKTWNTMRDAVKSAWEGVKKPIQDTWNWIKQHVFDPMGKFIKEDVPGYFDKAVAMIKGAWDKVKETVSNPIKFVVNTVIRDGIVKGFNAIASKVGVSPIDFGGMADGGVVRAANAPAGGRGNSRGFATGGTLPGYTPGRDVHQFVSPTGGRLELSGGEAVMRPEWTRAVGKGFVDTMNMAARTGGITGVRRAMGFANGGVIGTQSFKGGGVLETFSSWFEDLTGMVKSAGSAINDLVAPVKGGNWLGSMLKGTVKTLGTGIKNFITHSFSGGGGGDSTKLGNVGGGQGYQWQIDVLQKAGLNPRITSTTGGGHAKGSYHYQGRAIDIGNDSMSMFNWIAQNYGSRTQELIYGPAGGNSIWHGQKHNYGSELMRQHMDHIHWAMKNGGTFKYDQGGWLNHGQTGVNLTGKPEAVLTPAESRGLKNMGTGELLSKLDELIDAVERVAPGVGGFIRGSGRGAVALGRSV